MGLGGGFPRGGGAGGGGGFPAKSTPRRKSIASQLMGREMPESAPKKSGGKVCLARARRRRGSHI